MLSFRLENVTNDEILFGLENLSANNTIQKLNNGVAKIRPYTHVTPYYKNSKFAFVSLNAFKFFLFSICQFSMEDIEFLEELGFVVNEQDLGVYSKGLSKLFCTYFDDEVVESKKVRLTDLFANADSRKYSDIVMPMLSKESIKDCKDHYYKNVKFYK